MISNNITLVDIFFHTSIILQRIHDCLSRHSFNTDAAAAELSRVYNKSDAHAGYVEWRKDYDKKEAESKHSSITNNVLLGQAQSFKRQATEEPVTKKKKGNIMELQSKPFFDDFI